MKRREFLVGASLAAAATCAPHCLRAEDKSQVLKATLTVDAATKGATVPVDFTGLSYESAQLANPAFFSATNTALVNLFRELGGAGVLRLGGGTSEFTAFTTDEQTGPAPFDAVGPDTSRNVKSDTPITLASLRNLRAFLDATGWRCLYGLNLGRGPVARAALEAEFAQKILETRLLAFQLGNEPDAWRNRYRPASWTYGDYWKEWSAAHDAIAARVPDARFAGPDVSNKMAYVTGFAEDVKKSAHDVVLLTSHYYAMGPAGARDVTLDKLLSPDPKLERDLATAMAAAREAGVPYRMSEGNSCWNGGQPGVSDTLASALWVVDMMLSFARMGCAGVNLHGGGNGFYTPIAGDLKDGFTRRPEFYGMLFAGKFAGATLVASHLECPSDRISAYAAENSSAQMIAAINKTAGPVEMLVPLHRARRHWLLTGAAIDAKEGVTLADDRAAALHGGVLRIPAYSAVLVEA